MGRACRGRGEERRNSYRLLLGNLEVKRLCGRLDLYWRIIFKFILQQEDGRVWTAFI
jgi:hypothetical protein